MVRLTNISPAYILKLSQLLDFVKNSHALYTCVLRSRRVVEGLTERARSHARRLRARARVSHIAFVIR